MVSKLTAFLQESIQNKKDQGLYNEVDILSSENGPIIKINGHKLINLASNNYLGLATDEKLKEAATEAIQNFGVGSGAVRSINGTLTLHQQLEKALAQFKGTQAALAFQSGFNCNMGVISAVVDKNDVIFSDALNHASIIDGCRLSGAKIIRYNHSDMEDFYQKVKAAKDSNQYNKMMVITDGVFSMDGDVALLPEIVKIAEEFDLITYVDDAHGSGVMGQGAGTVKHFGLQDKVDIQMGTLSKAVGVVGGYVAGTSLLIDWLKVAARPFLFSTASTPADTAAALAAIEKLSDSSELQAQLWENARYLQEGLKELGFELSPTETPITPVIIGDEQIAQKFSKRLMEEGVYAKAIVFPTVPLGTGRIRNMPTAAHQKDQLDQAIASYHKIGKELGILS